MNFERFHNELAMRLGYERIMKDIITIEESKDPMVTLRVKGYDDISFKVSKGLDVMDSQTSSEVVEIADAVHKAYMVTINCRF